MSSEKQSEILAEVKIIMEKIRCNYRVDLIEYHNDECVAFTAFFNSGGHVTHMLTYSEIQKMDYEKLELVMNDFAGYAAITALKRGGTIGLEDAGENGTDYI